MNEQSLNLLNYACSRCGCSGIHACTGSPIVWTEDDKERLRKALDKFFQDNKKNEQLK